MQFASPLYPAVTLLLAAVTGLSLSKLLRISPIVCFFALGAIVGPHCLSIVDHNTSGLHFLAELGVCFLLFDVGLHLSLRELRQEWRSLLSVGILQFAIVTGVLGYAIWFLGLELQSAMVLGAIFSLSSTALVLKILADNNEQASPVGKRATEILVLQDVVAILLLVFFTGAQGGTLTFSDAFLPSLKMLGAAVVMVTVGRIVLHPFFKLLVALNNDEVFTPFALLLVLFTSWVTESLGLSLALGAFLGGLALSESNYAYIVRNEISPFRILLLSLFFLTVGMSLDVVQIAENASLLFLLLFTFVALKAGANWLAFKLSGMERSSATRLGFLLAQGSEFSFVLLAAAQQSGLLAQDSVEISIAAVGLSLALTPIFGNIGCLLSRSVCHIAQEGEAKAEDRVDVVIVGFDDFGREIADILEENGIDYRGHDRDLTRLTYAKSRGYEVFYSDLNRPRTVSRAVMGKVRAVICLAEDDEVVKFLVSGLQKAAATVPILAATSDSTRLELLLDLGVDDSFLKTSMSMPHLLEKLFNHLKFAPERVSDILLKLQAKDDGGFFPRAGAELTEASVSA